MAKFSFRATEEHMVLGLERFRAARRVPLYLLPIKSLCFLGIGALLVLALVNKVWGPACVFALLLILLLLGPKIDYWCFKRRLRKSPFYRSEVEVVLSEEGCIVTDRSSRVELKWNFFNKAVRFSDGFLMFIGSHQFYWWPTASLVSGIEDEVDDLLKRKLQSYCNA